MNAGTTAPPKSPRRTLLRIDSKSFPDYFHVSNSSFRLMFNAEMEALERLGFVKLEWVRFDRGIPGAGSVGRRNAAGYLSGVGKAL